MTKQLAASCRVGGDLLRLEIPLQPPVITATFTHHIVIGQEAEVFIIATKHVVVIVASISTKVTLLFGVDNCHFAYCITFDRI